MCFNLSAQQTDNNDKLYRDVSLEAMRYMYIFQNENPITDPMSFLENFKKDAKILNDIPSLHINSIYSNSKTIKPSKYVDLIVNDPMEYDPESIGFDLIIKEIGDLELIGKNDGYINIFATKEKDDWKLNENGFKFPETLDLKFRLYFISNSDYLKSKINKINSELESIPISEQYDANLNYKRLKLDLLQAEKNLEELKPNSFHFEIVDVKLAQQEKSMDFGYFGKNEDLVTRIGPHLIRTQTKSWLFGRLKEGILNAEIDGDTIQLKGVQVLDAVKYNRDKGFWLLKSTDPTVSAKLKIYKDPSKNKTTFYKGFNVYDFKGIEKNLAVSFKYKTNLSPVRYVEDIDQVSKNGINNSKELLVYFRLNNLLSLSSDNFNVYLSAGFETGEYNYQLTDLLHSEEYRAYDFGGILGYDRTVKLQNINEDQSLKIDKIIFPKLEFNYTFNQNLFRKNIKPSISFSVGLNQMQFKSIEYYSTADGYYSGILSEDYSNVEIDDSNRDIHDFGSYRINSGQISSLEFINNTANALSFGVNFGLDFSQSYSFNFGIEHSRYPNPVFVDEISDGEPALSTDYLNLNSLNNIIESDELRFLTFNFGINYKF
tara:strand:- start:59 stop:1861 length:1803 start_codon:yes stop_codon:yes gene_type:complete